MNMLLLWSENADSKYWCITRKFRNSRNLYFLMKVVEFVITPIFLPFCCSVFKPPLGNIFFYLIVMCLQKADGRRRPCSCGCETCKTWWSNNLFTVHVVKSSCPTGWHLPTGTRFLHCSRNTLYSDLSNVATERLGHWLLHLEILFTVKLWKHFRSIWLL